MYLIDLSHDEPGKITDSVSLPTIGLPRKKIVFPSAWLNRATPLPVTAWTMVVFEEVGDFLALSLKAFLLGQLGYGVNLQKEAILRSGIITWFPLLKFPILKVPSLLLLILSDMASWCNKCSPLPFLGHNAFGSFQIFSLRLFCVLRGHLMLPQS